MTSTMAVVVEANEKYLINVDFNERSRVHLNPAQFHLDSRCQTGPKDPKAGGTVTVSSEQAQRYLDRKATLIFEGRPVTNLQTCALCSKRREYGLKG